MRKWLILLTILTISCGSGGKDDSSHATPDVRKAPGFIGYSVPNSWHLIDAESFAAALGRSGLTATEIEWSPFHDSPPVCAGTTNATYPEQARIFIEAMRREGITTYINIVNANGCAQTRLPTEWFQTQLDIIKSYGINGLMLGGVSEPWANSDPKLHSWEKLAETQWQGFFVAPANGSSASPFWRDVEYDYLDSHPCTQRALDDLFAKRAMVLIPNTDCTPLLNPGPERAAEWTQLALDHESNLLVYDFHALEPDLATIAAMGGVIQKQSPQ